MHSLDKLAPEMQAKIPQDVMLKLESSMASLEAALLKQDPLMPSHLRESHRLLISYPETVHLLEDEDIEALVNASMKHMNVQIVSEAAKGKGGSKKKLGLSDL